MNARTTHCIIGVLAVLVVTIALPLSAPAQILNVISCAAKKGNMPLPYTPPGNFPVDIPGTGEKMRGSIVDVGMPDGAFGFQFESDVPFRLVVYKKSEDGQRWIPHAVRAGVPTGAAGFRYTPTSNLVGESVYRFAMVPDNQNAPARMRSSWTANCDGSAGAGSAGTGSAGASGVAGSGGGILPPGCGPLLALGFTDFKANRLREEVAVIKTQAGTTTRFCVQVPGSPNLYTCGLADRGGKGYDFDYTVEDMGTTPHSTAGKPPLKHYRITFCKPKKGNPLTEDATLEWVNGNNPEEFRQIVPSGSTRKWWFYF